MLYELSELMFSSRCGQRVEFQAEEEGGWGPKRPESGATSITSFCTSLNFGCAASQSSPRITDSDVVKKAPDARRRSNAYILHEHYTVYVQYSRSWINALLLCYLCIPVDMIAWRDSVHHNVYIIAAREKLECRLLNAYVSLDASYDARTAKLPALAGRTGICRHRNKSALKRN